METSGRTSKVNNIAVSVATAVFTGCGYFAECRKLSEVVCRKSSAERSANYPLSLFRILQPKNSAFPRIAKLPFARIAQQMCNRCEPASGIPGSLPSVFIVVHLPKNRVVFFLQFRLTYSSTFQVSCHFASRCNWFQFVRQSHG